MLLTYGRLGEMLGQAGTSPIGDLAKVNVAARVAVKVARLAKKLQGETDPLNTARGALQEKYKIKELAEKLKPIHGDNIPDELLPPEFIEELIELMDTEFELDIQPIELPPDADVTAALLLVLDGVVTVKE